MTFHPAPTTSNPIVIKQISISEMIKEVSYTSPTSGDDLSLRSLSSEDVSQAPRGYCCAKSANPAYGMGRRLHLLQMLVLPFIPILALIVQTTFILINVMIHRQEVMDIETQVVNGAPVGPVIGLVIERIRYVVLGIIAYLMPYSCRVLQAIKAGSNFELIPMVKCAVFSHYCTNYTASPLLTISTGV